MVMFGRRAIMHGTLFCLSWIEYLVKYRLNGSILNSV